MCPSKGYSLRKKSNSGTLNRYKMTFYRTQKELRTPSEADKDNFRGEFKVLDKIEVRFAKEWEHMTDKGGVKFSCTVKYLGVKPQATLPVIL